MRRAVGAVLLAVLLTLVGCSRTHEESQVPQLDEAPVPIVSLSIPDLGIKAEVVPVGVDAKSEIDITALDKDPADVGQYQYSSPGVDVLLGHVNYRGPAVFGKLKTMTSGDTFEVGRSDGTTEQYTVTHTEQIPKKSFPGERIYTEPVGGSLRLVTCDGIFNKKTGSYESNFIVFADKVDS